MGLGIYCQGMSTGSLGITLTLSAVRILYAAKGRREGVDAVDLARKADESLSAVVSTAQKVYFTPAKPAGGKVGKRSLQILPRTSQQPVYTSISKRCTSSVFPVWPCVCAVCDGDEFRQPRRQGHGLRKASSTLLMLSGTFSFFIPRGTRSKDRGLKCPSVLPPKRTNHLLLPQMDLLFRNKVWRGARNRYVILPYFVKCHAMLTLQYRLLFIELTCLPFWHLAIP